MIKTLSNIPKIRSYVIGCGMTKFERPGNRDYLDMTQEAVTKALRDARIDYRKVKHAIASFCYGESCSGHRALYQMGMTDIPIHNVSNNCSTGGTALILAKLLIETGKSDCVLALGFEEMELGSLETQWNDRTVPLDKNYEQMLKTEGISAPASELFGNAGEEHMRKYGSKSEHFAKIAYKNHKHSVNNPYSQFQDEYTLEQIKTSPQVYRVLTKLQCCPTSDGSACCIVASEDFVRKHKLESQAVEIVAMEMNTDFESTFNEKSSIKLVGYDLTKVAAQKVFAQTNYKPQDVDVVELHDCFSANELITYEALGLCPEEKAHEMIDRNDNTYGGKYVINPSGGLISKGHPLGATGLAQCSELCWQLRGEADKRQVQNCKLALQHNFSLGGAVIIALYRLGFPDAPKQKSPSATQTSCNAKPKTAAGNNKVKPTPDGFLVSPLMNLLDQALLENKDNIVEKVPGTYGFRVTNGPGRAEGYWVVHNKSGKGKLIYNGSEKTDLTYTLDDETITALLKGELNPLIPFFQGKVKISGNIGMAFKLVFFQQTLLNIFNEIRHRS